MTNEEAKKKLEAKLVCLNNQISGVNYDCNMRLCDACPLNYEQGNAEEQKDALYLAIKALEATEQVITPKQKIGKWIIHPLYNALVCSKCLSGAPYKSCEANYCPNCGAKMKESED